MNHSDISIAFFDTKSYDRSFFEAANQKEKFGFRLTWYETRLTPNSARMTEGSDVVCAFVNDDLCGNTIRQLAKIGVKLIALRCAGFNNVSLRTASHVGLPVVRVPAYSPHAVAEYSLGLLLTLNRHIHRAFNRVRENNFSIHGLIGFDLHGKTVGIIGTGKIGLCFAQVLQGFGVRILAYDPFPNPKAARELGMDYVPLEWLLKESDVISLHCPLTPENVHLIRKETISEMKDGVILINTSRGKLIQTSDLIEALKSGKVSHAGLDVYEEESDYFFEDRSNHPIDDDLLARLMTFPNVIVSSHQAFFTREALTNIAETTLENVRDFYAEQRLPNRVCEKGTADVRAKDSGVRRVEAERAAKVAP